MILNFCRHLFAPDKFFHILIPFLKKKTVDPFFALGKNQQGKLFVQDCNTHSLVPFLFEARCTVRTYPFLSETEDFFSGSLPSTRIRSKRSPKTHLFENARRRGDFWKRHFGTPSPQALAASTGRIKKSIPALPVNAHAPIKDGAVFSNYCVFEWTDKNDSKRQCADADFVKTEKKNPRFQAKTDTCGPGLRRWSGEGNYVRNQNKTIERLQKKHRGLLYLNFHWILRVIVLWIQ